MKWNKSPTKYSPKKDIWQLLKPFYNPVGKSKRFSMVMKLFPINKNQTFNFKRMLYLLVQYYENDYKE